MAERRAGAHRSAATTDEERMTGSIQAAPATTGVVMRSHARWYDVLVWVLTLGRERALRERILALARLQIGDSILDVGCGTGTLAIAARRHVGDAGEVFGVDASPEMIARAVAKASRRRAAVDFRVGVVEALP